MKLNLALTLSVLGLGNGQKMANSYGHHLHPDFAEYRRLQDCSGQGTTWGPGIGPPPDGCGSEGGPGGDSGGGPGGAGMGGSSSSSACAITSGTCATDGSTNAGADVSNLSYASSTGKFSGSIITNQCNDHERLNEGGGSPPGNNAVSCIEQTVPVSTTTPQAIPTLGMAALTLSGGVNIYSAFEAGFNDCAVDGMPCACDGASCAAGMDVGACEAHLHHSCTSEVATAMFMDTCGGHADPYHIHTDPVCNYSADSATGHSTIVGVSLDGYGIYGKFETSNQRPCDLDVCHGHVGVVPASTEFVDIASSSVYHYHVSDASKYPYTWTLGCYGDPDTPVDLATCNSLYDGCGTSGDTETIFTAEYPGGLDVKLWCPCFDVEVPEGCSGDGGDGSDGSDGSDGGGEVDGGGEEGEDGGVVDCSGEGTTWGPGLGPPPEGCSSSNEEEEEEEEDGTSVDDQIGGDGSAGNAKISFGVAGLATAVGIALA
ncbi:hypothetical protein TrCOL_g7062 [Triparma columacea]|uniref:YHYH domain-containing protein n=1 Tax=Triparma columacea TaxID=722753 RepID=A0A9W7L3B6_9STRA|nr:hypothetical protein TrCOL_g7062 [Triparma columacea]